MIEMLRRRPLARMAVRTTVVAGTAAAVGAHAANKQADAAAQAAEPAPEELAAADPGSTAISPEQIQELSQLAALKDSGVLTQAEFDAQKAKLLA
jgi:Short C-terminal domain